MMDESGTNISGDVNTGGGDFIGRDQNIHLHVNLPAQTDRPVYLLPPKPGLVIGREEHLAELKQRLGLSGGEPGQASLQVLTAMRGWPGVGKTTLASLLAHDPQTRQAFPDGILWTSLGPELNASPLPKLAEWGRALGSQSLAEARNPEEAQRILAGLLRERRMLLLIDDVWQSSQARPFLAGGARCATLLTTRQSEIASQLTATPEQVFLLPVLSDEKALELLAELAPAVAREFPALALTLVQALEGLPLAIQVAGRLLQAEISRGFGVEKLIQAIQAGAALLQANAPADRADLVNQTTPTVAALLLTSLEHLDEFTRECYAYLGVFAPKPATFDLQAMQFVWDVNDPQPVVATLVDRGLLEYLPDLKRYQMHALLVMLAKTLLTEE